MITKLDALLVLLHEESSNRNSNSALSRIRQAASQLGFTNDDLNQIEQHFEYRDSKDRLYPAYEEIKEAQRILGKRHGAIEVIRSAAVLKNGVVYVCWAHTYLELKRMNLDVPDDVLKHSEQGFVTNTGRFVDREEALLIAQAAGQIKHKHGGPDTLYSEDLREIVSPSDATMEASLEIARWMSVRNPVSPDVEADNANSIGGILSRHFQQG